ncbi:MAG: S49 family peptidase [Magnetococcales bacterium]|nr:S49 family peptidase [Magnetococcales bacterium]
MEKTEPSFKGPEGGAKQESPIGGVGGGSASQFLERLIAALEEGRAAEREAMSQLFQETLREQKKNRRSKNWFRFFIAAYLAALLWLAYSDTLPGVEMDALSSGKSHTAVVDIRGSIMANGEYSAEKVIDGLQEAFKDPDTAGVVLRINSPGGSPVQSGMIYDEIQRLTKKYPSKPLYAALEDICASGGYYIASAAKEIFADKASLVGSIGVVLRSFGFEETLNKVGAENRTLTAGKSKAFLDPFGPVKEEDRLHAQGLLDKIHRQFINAVRKGRGKRLKSWEKGLFEGLVWTGEEAVAKGLVDGLGSTAWIARERIKAEKVVDFTKKKDWVSRVSENLAGTFFDALALRTIANLE